MLINELPGLLMTILIVIVRLVKFRREVIKKNESLVDEMEEF